MEEPEDGAVEDLPGFGAACSVELLGVPQERDDLLQAVEDFVAGGLCVLDKPSGVGNLGAHSGLAFLERIDGQRVCHVGVDEFLLVPFQLGQAALLVGDEPGAGFGGAVQVVASALAERRNLVVGEVHSEPLPPDGLFGLDDREVWQVAGGAFGEPAEAEEVVVVTAMPLRGAVADAAAAPSAPERTFEVVVVPPGAVAVDAPVGQHVLDLLPEHVIDERLMGAVVEDAVEHDLPLVVGVGQHAVQLAGADRLADQLAGGAGLETSLLKFVTEIGQRVVARGVLLEYPADMLGAIGVRDDRLDLDAVDLRGVVEVPERRNVRGAAAPDLLGHALLGLVGQVLRVVLGDGRHDAMQQ